MVKHEQKEKWAELRLSLDGDMSRSWIVLDRVTRDQLNDELSKKKFNQDDHEDRSGPAAANKSSEKPKSEVNKTELQHSMDSVAEKLKSATRSSRMISVFNQENLSYLKEKWKKGERDTRERVNRDIEFANRNDGFREVPKFKSIGKTIANLHHEFPNFARVIDSLAEDLVLSGRPRDFNVSPKLMNGSPGIGKTHFAQQIAGRLGVPFLKISSAMLQSAAQITGTSTHWSTSNAGLIFNLLAKHESAVAVVLLDEVDKVSSNDFHPIIPALLELLERETSRAFEDQSNGIKFDASRLIFLATSNNIEKTDKALLSRFEVTEIKTPSSKQRKTIATELAMKMCANSGKKLSIDTQSMDTLIEQGGDLRMLMRSVKSSVARTLMNEQKQVVFKKEEGMFQKRLSGFYRESD
jgi:ATP-dependent Lon protease